MIFRILVFLLAIAPAFCKVRILTFHYNMPKFIELQDKSLKAFFLDDYELIVFNDAALVEHEIAIQQECERLGIQCVRFEQGWHLTDPLNYQVDDWLKDINVASHLQFPDKTLIGIANQPSIRHAHVIQYALDHYGYTHDDVVVLMDGDAFMMREMSLKKEMMFVDFFGLCRHFEEVQVIYPWVPFIAFDPRHLPNVSDLHFNPSVINRVLYDTGADAYHYLKNHPHLLLNLSLGDSSSHYEKSTVDRMLELGFSGEESWFVKTLPKGIVVEFFLNHSLLHFGSSSFELKGHFSKAQIVQDFIDLIVDHHNSIF